MVVMISSCAKCMLASERFSRLASIWLKVFALFVYQLNGTERNVRKKLNGFDKIVSYLALDERRLEKNVDRRENLLRNACFKQCNTSIGLNHRCNFDKVLCVVHFLLFLKAYLHGFGKVIITVLR